MRIAEAGIQELQQYVDTLLIIPNQNLFRIADDNTTFADAFAMADEVLHSGVRGITDLMIVPGLINLDFADVRSVMSEMGKAMMGTGEAEGEKRAAEAAEAAISNPLLDEVSMKGAKGVLINITGGMDMKLFEVDEAANRIRSEVDPDANIIVGSTFSHELEGKMRVSVVATGIDAEGAILADPQQVAAAIQSAPQAEARPWVSNLTPQAPVIEPEVEVSEEPELFSEPASAPEQVAPSAQPTPVAAKPSAAAKIEDKQNPIGDVHDRIRKMLTEDEDQPLQPIQPQSQKDLTRANPFREEQKGGKSPLNVAVDLIKETFGVPGEPSSGAPRPTRGQKPLRSSEGKRELFQDEKDADLEIPAFLRRKSGR